MKPNSRTRAGSYILALDPRNGNGSPLPFQPNAERLAREFRAVRRQARQAVRRELLAEIKRASTTCDVNDAWGMGVIAGLEAAAEMAKGKAKR